MKYLHVVNTNDLGTIYLQLNDHDEETDIETIKYGLRSVLCELAEHFNKESRSKSIELLKEYMVPVLQKQVERLDNIKQLEAKWQQTSDANEKRKITRSIKSEASTINQNIWSLSALPKFISRKKLSKPEYQKLIDYYDGVQQIAFTKCTYIKDNDVSRIIANLKQYLTSTHKNSKSIKNIKQGLLNAIDLFQNDGVLIFNKNQINNNEYSAEFIMLEDDTNFMKKTALFDEKHPERYEKTMLSMDGAIEYIEENSYWEQVNDVALI